MRLFFKRQIFLLRLVFEGRMMTLECGTSVPLFNRISVFTGMDISYCRWSENDLRSDIFRSTASCRTEKRN